MATWTPIVFSATYRVDYRLLCAPPSLAQGTLRRWVTSFAVSALHAPDLTSAFQNWALFQNERWRVVGIGCWASDVAGAHSDKVVDDQNRRISLFLGFAAQPDSHGRFPNPPMCNSGLKPFRGLYDFVLKHWDEAVPKATEEVTGYSVAFDAGERHHAPGQIQINTDKHRMALWPDTKSLRIQLWREVSASVETQSIMVGFTKQRFALGTPFLNGTAQDVKSDAVILRR